MSFDADEYRQRRKDGLRGQGDTPKPQRVLYPAGYITNRKLERAKRKKHDKKLPYNGQKRVVRKP